MRAWFCIFLLSLSAFGADVRKLNGNFRATAYAQSGITKSGEWTHRHIVAADPAVLPIGTRLKIRRAGKYSGEYVVADTGSKVVGRHLDIYMPSEAACKKFGSRTVKVKIIELGDGTREAVKEADQEVKQNVAEDLKKKVVGNSATQEDWSKSPVSKTAAKEAASQTAPAKPAAPPEPPGNM